MNLLHYKFSGLQFRCIVNDGIQVMKFAHAGRDKNTSEEIFSMFDGMSNLQLTYNLMWHPAGFYFDRGEKGNTNVEKFKWLVWIPHPDVNFDYDVGIADYDQAYYGDLLQQVATHAFQADNILDDLLEDDTFDTANATKAAIKIGMSSAYGFIKNKAMNYVDYTT